MKIFLDTNILLDFFVEDRPNSLASLEIFRSIKNNEHSAYCTIITISDCLYVLEVSYKVKGASDLLSSILNWINILPSSKTIVEAALNSSFKDKEDALQYYSVLEYSNIDLMISNDNTGFNKSEIPVFTPTQFVKKHLNK